MLSAQKICFFLGFLSLANAFLYFDRDRFWYNENLTKAALWFTNSTSGDAILYNQDVLYKVEVQAKQARMKLSFPSNDFDRDYTNQMISTTVDSCKQFRGIATNYVVRAFMQNLNMSPFSCPFQPNHHFTIFNLTISQFYLPPLPMEVKWKVEAKWFGRIASSKGWKPLYGFEVYGRFKK